jgi:hypothetical protein
VKGNEQARIFSTEPQSNFYDVHQPNLVPVLPQVLTDDPDSPYWLVPFQNYGTLSPYRMGSYHAVAAKIRRYPTIGYRGLFHDVLTSAVLR